MASEQTSSLPTYAFFLFLGALGVYLIGYFAGFDESFFHLFLGLEVLGVGFFALALFRRAALDKDDRSPLKFPVRTVVIVLAVLGAVYFLGSAFLDGLANGYRF